ncbi:MAG: hypothetical protein D6785_09930, partial [Planctomycetota bacterium]
DNQRIGWKNKNIQEYLEELNKDQVLFVLHNLGTNANNIGITDLKLATQCRARLPFRFSAKIKNFGTQDLDRGLLKVSILKPEDYWQKESRKTLWPSTSTTFSLLAGEEKLISLPPMILEKEGVYFAKASIQKISEDDEDALPLDNVRFFAFVVQRSARILLVDGEVGELSETDFLRLALNPNILDAKDAPSLFTPIRRTTLPEKDLEDYEAIVLANYGNLSPLEAQKLEDYVQKGGGLVIFLGENFRRKTTYFDSQKGKKVEEYPAVKKYNLYLYRDGKGILPGKLKWMYRKTYANLAPKSYSHPLFHFFENYKDRLGAPRFDKYLEIHPASKATVLATFTDASGTPAILEQSYGQGKVLLFNTSADRDWTNFPVTQAYLIFVRSMVSYVAKKSKTTANYLIGQSLVFPWKEGYELELHSPMGDEMINPVEKKEDLLVIKPEMATQIGFYELRWRLGVEVQKKDYFSINRQDIEGDLESSSEEETKGYLAPLTLDFRSQDESRTKEISLKITPKGHLWSHFMFLAFFFLLFEIWLAYWFGAKDK